MGRGLLPGPSAFSLIHCSSVARIPRLYSRSSVFSRRYRYDSTVSKVVQSRIRYQFSPQSYILSLCFRWQNNTAETIILEVWKKKMSGNSNPGITTDSRTRISVFLGLNPYSATQQCDLGNSYNLCLSFLICKVGIRVPLSASLGKLKDLIHEKGWEQCLAVGEDSKNDST